jgi:hypothetical protein
MGVTTRLATLVLSLALLSSYSVAQETEETTGTVHGVLTTDVDGGRVVILGIKVTLNGPTHIEAVSDGEGKVAFSRVPLGSYKATAQMPGLSAVQDVVVAAGIVSEVAVEMKVTLMTESTTVRVSAKADDSVAASTVRGSTVQSAPNITEHFDSLLPLVPGVVRGPDGLINIKGARSSQNGSLVNNVDVTDPVTGQSAITLPIDVASSVQVLSTPYDPVYSKFTGAVSNIETRTGDFNKFRASAQNLIPRLRDRDGSIVGLAAVTPRVTITGPVAKNRVALTESLEYRYERIPVNSLPPLQRDTRNETFDSYTQIDATFSQKQAATVSFALFPQKLDYFGLNTFTSQPATPNLHERGYQAGLQHRYIPNSGSLLSSQLSFRHFNADVLANSSTPYQLRVEITEGGFFNHQHRQSSRVEWQEIFHLSLAQILWNAGLESRTELRA